MFRIVLLSWLCFLGSPVMAAEAPDPDHILNFHRISAQLVTAGQVFPVHVPLLEAEQVEYVVNLAPPHEMRNREESFHVTSKGMPYVQIPVQWEQPTQADLELFFAVMDARGDRNTLVHCFANYRASAFTYLYRVIRMGVADEVALRGLEAVWDEAAFKEYPQWRRFIDDSLARARADS